LMKGLWPDGSWQAGDLFTRKDRPWSGIDFVISLGGDTF